MVKVLMFVSGPTGTAMLGACGWWPDYKPRDPQTVVLLFLRNISVFRIVTTHLFIRIT
jgi:hypothetical protein